MTTADRAFALYVEFKLRQHARAIEHARANRNHPRRFADYIAQAAMIRGVLAQDLANH
jgi:hypothetical protein